MTPNTPTNESDATMSENTVSTSTDLDVLDTTSDTSLALSIANLGTGKASFYSSLQGEDFATKVATVEAMTNSIPIKENLNTTINVKNIIVQKVPMVNERTGAFEDQPRIVLLDADGTAYHAISGGLYRSIDNIINIVGEPHVWPAPLPIHIVSVKGRQGDFYTAKIGAAPKK